MGIQFRSSISPLIRFMLSACLIGGTALWSWAQPNPPQENALLWEIKGKGIKKSYLYGTIHMIPRDDFFILEAVEAAMKKSDHLVMELSMNMGLSSIFSTFRGVMLPKGQSLKDVLSEAQYDRLDQMMKENMGMDLGNPMMGRIKPFFLAQMLSGQDCQTGSQQSYEMYFKRRFKRMDKPVSGLETVKEQLAALDQIPMDVQIESLMEAVDNPGQGCEVFQQMVEIYRNQDLTSMMELMEGDQQLGGSLDFLLKKRNENWIPLIKEMGKKEKLFIAVGAGHLGGEYGVVNLLRQQGFKLRPVLEPTPQ
ncbi:MAG: TraB/GumN family protein [Bacteroidota bacterium]